MSLWAVCKPKTVLAENETIVTTVDVLFTTESYSNAVESCSEDPLKFVVQVPERESLLDRVREQIKNAGILRGSKYDRLRDRFFTGHVSIGPVTVFGANAMHYAMSVRTRRGYFCARPTTGEGKRWKWYAYLSPNGTPNAATWGVGPGFRQERA